MCVHHFVVPFALTAAQFKRAVRIATGHNLSENVLDTVFKIFDLDGDNCLSHKEFLGVMKDRMLRGLKVTLINLCSGRLIRFNDLFLSVYFIFCEI